MSQTRIFSEEIFTEALNSIGEGCLISHLGIEIIEIGPDFLRARMPVDKRTRQPMGLLHGGASLVLAESLGSYASTLLVDMTKYHVVGLEINANHMRAVHEGYVYGTVAPLHIGRRTHVWNIEIKNEEGKLVCVSRLTIAIIDHD